MTQVPSNQPSLMGQMQFYDNYIPVLHDGEYNITVTQKLVGDGDTPEHNADETFELNQRFTITGPRFALDPADIHRQFPPPTTQGRFELVLPHVTITKRALPWERHVFSNEKIPWLALLVLTEEEILPPIIGTAVDQPDKPNPLGSSTILLEELTDPPSAEPKVVYPDVTFYPYEKPDQSLCSVIDISPETFNAIVPSQADLAYLAHGRKVNVENKSTTYTIDAPGTRVEDGTQWFSVIVAGRLPYAAKAGTTDNKTYKNIAHLVTLEGLTQYIPETTGGSATTFPAGTDRVRLVSLASWSFDCLNCNAQSFADLMEGLVPDSDTKRDDLLLRLPQAELPENPTPTQTYAADAIAAGYTARTYATRQGENSFAWYRGPFAPQLPERFPKSQAPFQVAGQAVIYDSDKGLFDMSYASAFEIGRMAALHSGVMSASLLRWRQTGAKRLDKMASRLSSTALQSLFAARPQTLQSHAGSGKALLADGFVNYMATSFVDNILPRVGASNSAVPQGVGDLEVKGDVVSNPATELAQALNAPMLSAALAQTDDDDGGEDPDMPPILDFLGNLYLLKGVPFQYLVPDQRMLPPESVRFFHVDRNWLDSLVDGATSIGMHTSIERGVQAAMYNQVQTGTYGRIHTTRNAALGVKKTTAADTGDIGLTGLLLRSEVVSGWPGLEVHAEDKDGKEIPLLRMDHLSKQVLLCIFNGQPARVMVNEPQEGLHFGVESNDNVYLRNLSGEKVGWLVEPNKAFTAKFNGDRMLDIPSALADIKSGLGLSDPPGPAGFAVQMVAVPERFNYTMPGLSVSATSLPQPDYVVEAQQ